jgi:hypothetical protein
MAIEYEKDRAVFGEVVSVDEAEALLEWLQKNPAAHIDLSHCTHMHAANLQVLMTAGPAVSEWPEDAAFAGWLQAALGIQ